MRRSILSLAPLTLCVLAAFACDDVRVASLDPLDLDAGNFDGSIPPIPVVDAGDAGEDASLPPATVTVLGSPAARTGIEVVFGDAAGAVLGTAQTDANGRATVPDGTAMVTALLRNEASYSLVTWTAVAAADTLTVRGLEPLENEALVGSFRVALGNVPEPLPGMGQYFELESSSLCRAERFGIPSDPIQLDVRPACVFGTTSTVLATQFTAATSGQKRNFGFKKNLALPGAATDVAVDTWVSTTRVPVKATNIPVDSFVGAQLFEIASGAPFNRQDRSLDTELGSVDFDIVPGFADAIQAGYRVDQFDTSHNSLIVRAATAAGMTADLGSPLPAIVLAEPTGDRARPTITWTGDTAQTAGGAIRLPFRGPNANASYTWTILVPAGTTTVTAPALPAAASDFVPLSDAPVVFASGAFVAGPGLTPAALRAFAFASIDVATNEIESVFLETPMPANGTYKLTTFRQQQR